MRKTNGDDRIHSHADGLDQKGNYNGLTKREHFAALLMPQILRSEVSKPIGIEAAAIISVSAADALIEALNKEAGE